MFSQSMAHSSWKTLYNQHISFSQSFGIHLTHQNKHISLRCVGTWSINMWSTSTMKTWQMRTKYSVLKVCSVTALEMPWSSKKRNCQNSCILQCLMRMISNFNVYKMNGFFLFQTVEQCAKHTVNSAKLKHVTFFFNFHFIQAWSSCM